MTLPSDSRQTQLEATVAALRQALASSGILVQEYDWNGSFAYGAPQIFAYLWPHATHVTVGLLQGSLLRPISRRLLGQGPVLRTVMVRTPDEVDADLIGILGRAADLAMRKGLR